MASWPISRESDTHMRHCTDWVGRNGKWGNEEMSKYVKGGNKKVLRRTVMLNMQCLTFSM